MIILKSASLNLLYTCLKNQRPDLLWILDSQETVYISNELGNELRDAVGDELLINGLNEDLPNQYGILLEDLIDEFGRLFMYN